MKYEVEVTKYNTIWRNPETKQLHRLDGPAIVYSNGPKDWYVDGKQYSENDFNNLLEKIKLSTKVKPCSGKVVIVDGIEYTLS